MIRIYTDGSHIKKPQPAWGSGAYLIEGKERIVSIGGLGQSNQYAELMAIKGTLIWLNYNKEELDKEVTIISDSVYAIKCMKDWRYLWQRYKKDPDKISHYNLIKSMWDTFDDITNSGIKIKFKHVKSHGKDQTLSEDDMFGNNQADIIATEESKKAANF